MRRRAQSEALGFVLVFALVVTAVGLLTATGFAGLDHAQRAERTDNAVAAFEVLAANLDDVVDGAPARQTEVTLADARMYPGEPVTVNVSVGRASGPRVSREVEFGPLVYDAGGDARLVYSGGAVVREDRSGAVLLDAPPFRLGGDEAVLPLVAFHHSSPRSVGGETPVVVRTTRANATSLVETRGRYDVTVTVDSPRAAVWKRYFESHGSSCGPVSGGSVTCSTTVDRVYVSVVHVVVSLE